ncbi:MAG TPA: DUF2334 domain-containing protein, partial [bacterium]|nr:DUF2334 domain-containing protein [bacterium]
ALVRIEDVNPLSNPEDIRAVANYLGSQKVPFTLGLTPFYLDPEQNVTVSISDRPELVKALHHAVKKGAALLLHGCTHQYRGQTTVDYEFWDGLNDTPIFQDSRGYVKERINRALSECSKNGLFPLAWETPHYAASQLDYSVINEHFSTCYERRQTMDVTGTDQLLPFFIPKAEGYPQMIPENLGYISLDNPDPQSMLKYAANNRVVRDGFASFFFHPFVPLEALKELVNGIRELGYTFSDIRTLSHRVISDAGAFATGEGIVTVSLQDQYLEEFCVTPGGRYRDRIISNERVTTRISREVKCPPLYTAVFRPLTDEPARGLFSFFNRPVRFVQKLWKTTDLHPAVPSADVLILVHEAEEGELWLDQESYYLSFRTLGIPVRRLRASDFFEIPMGVNLLVIPRAADRYLTEQQAVIIMDAVARGMNLIYEKESLIGGKLGLTVTGDSVTVEEVMDEYYPRVPILWKEPVYYKPFDMPMEYITYYSDKATGDPLVVGGSYGEGRFVYLATLLDPLTGQGYARYPYFIDVIQRHFNLWPLFRFEKAHVYFEPGDRENTSIEDLVQMWKKSGFQVIYAAGWHVYAEWSYDYERLIKLAHQNAMLVYLWLELPHVNQKFWDENPSWREKTASGEDAIVDWRRLMALTDDSCRQAVLDEVSGMIQDYDWDGVNLAELYFESPLGPSRPDQLTPMHASVRRRFRSEYGYDPIDIFNESSPLYWRGNPEAWDRFEKFRQDLVVELHEIFLRNIESAINKKERDMEIVVTLVDNLIASQTGRYTGIDTRRLIPLQNQVPFTLQIEDPLELWHMGPGRYDRLHSVYRGLTDGTLIFDVNVVPIREFSRSLAPTRQPTGMELYRLISACRQDSNLLALYSESSIYEVDLPYIAHVLAGNVQGRLQTDYWNVSTPHPVVINLDADRHHDLRVNEALWPAYFKGRMLLPPGEHRIQTVPFIQNIANSLKSNARLVDMTGDLLECRMLGRGLEFRYRSSTMNHVILNEKPEKVWLDETIHPVKSEAGMTGYRLVLPRGTHSVRVITRTQGSFSLKNFSIIISALIITLSVGSGFLLAVLYGVRFIRRRRNRNS